MVKVANIVFNSFVNDSRVEKTSKSLVNNGYKVEVIAHLYKELKREELKDDYLIKRFAYLDRKLTVSKLAKLLIYLKWIKAVTIYCKNFDILHCNDLNTLPVGVIIKNYFNKNIKIVYDAHEYETETYALKGIQKKVAKFLEKKLIKYADKVITVSDSIANEYVKLYRIKKPALVLNTPIFKQFEKKDLFRKKFNLSQEKKIYLYQGGLTPNRGVELLLETFKELDNINAVIVFMGYGTLGDKIKKYSKKYDNIYYHDAVSPSILLNYTSSADFGISTIEDSCLSYRYCLPNKMFEYIMAEVPVIVSNLPEMSKIVKRYDIGVVANEDTSKGLEEAIIKALKLDKEKLKKNIQKVKEIYNWEEQEKILLKVYKELKQ